MTTTTDKIHAMIDQVNAMRHGEVPLSFSTHYGRIYRVNYGPARDKSYYQAYRLRDILAYLRAVKRQHRVEHGKRMLIDRGVPMVGMNDGPLACLLHGYADAHVLAYVREHVCPACSFVVPEHCPDCGVCIQCCICAGAESA